MRKRKEKRDCKRKKSNEKMREKYKGREQRGNRLIEKINRENKTRFRKEIMRHSERKKERVRYKKV